MNDLELLIAAGVDPAIAERLLAQIGEGRALATLTLHELASVGIPDAHARMLSAAIAIGRRASEPEPIIESPEAVWHAVRDLIYGLNQEVFLVLPLNTQHGLIAPPIEVSRGTVDQAIAHPREVFRAALRCGAAAIMLAHNHPSGNPTPSPGDIIVTQTMIAVGSIVGIPIVDHVVVTASNFRSIGEYMENHNL